MTWEIEQLLKLRKLAIANGDLRGLRAVNERIARLLNGRAA